MWDIIMWIVFGGLAGWIASMLTRTDENQGIIGNVVIGIIGAVVGGWIVSALGGQDPSGFSIYSLIVAIIGAVVLLAIVNFFRRGSARV